MAQVRVNRCILDWHDFKLLRGTELAQQMLRNKVTATAPRTMDGKTFVPRMTEWLIDQCSGMVVVREVAQNPSAAYGPGDRSVMLYFERETELAAFKLRWHGFVLNDGPG